MCGIAGFSDLTHFSSASERVLLQLLQTLQHRGPDQVGTFVMDSTALGANRLAIVGGDSGSQPIASEDGNVVMVCNGEVFNHHELRKELIERGHQFRSNTDIEVIIHLYEENGSAVAERLNGQFAFALFDKRQQLLLLARDHVGISPLFYTVVNGVLVFASEIKAILSHPLSNKQVDLRGFDQILCFPGIISPQTAFKDIFSLKPGHILMFDSCGLRIKQFWDLEYPEQDSGSYLDDEKYYVDGLYDRLMRAVERRIAARPLGIYLSGGLDSALIAALTCKVMADDTLHSFSSIFSEKAISERAHQRTIANALRTVHREVAFADIELADELPKMIYHVECPVKETFNLCALALSRAAHQDGLKVVLSGQGADELFGGYPGYRFDQFHLNAGTERRSDARELELREILWGDSTVFYERDYYSFGMSRRSLYSRSLQASFEEVDCLRRRVIDGKKIRNRHVLHQRSYLDVKLRLADHLLGGHSDRMSFANAVEGRHPFLDTDVINFARMAPPNLKLNNFEEKYLVKRVARDLVPSSIITREKFGFRAPGSSALLRRNFEFVNDVLCEETIRRQDVFDTDHVEQLKRQYMSRNSVLDPFFDDDVLMLVLTFGMWLKIFDMPGQ